MAVNPPEFFSQPMSRMPSQDARMAVNPPEFFSHPVSRMPSQDARMAVNPPEFFSQPKSRMPSLQPSKTALRNRLKIGFGNGTITRVAYTGLLRLVEYTNSKLKLKALSKKLSIAISDKHRLTNTKDLNDLSSFELSAKAHPHPKRGNLYEQFTLTPKQNFNELEAFKTYHQVKLRNFIQSQLQAKGRIKAWAQLAINGEWTQSYRRAVAAAAPAFSHFCARRLIWRSHGRI